MGGRAPKHSRPAVPDLDILLYSYVQSFSIWSFKVMLPIRTKLLSLPSIANNGPMLEICAYQRLCNKTILSLLSSPLCYSNGHLFYWPGNIMPLQPTDLLWARSYLTCYSSQTNAFRRTWTKKLYLLTYFYQIVICLNCYLIFAKI